jgi:hypothetical protein
MRNSSSATFVMRRQQREILFENLKADCEVRAGRPSG